MKNLFLPWRTVRTWNALSFLGLNLFSWIGFAIVVTGVSVSVALAITYPLATPFIFLTFAIAGLLARIERSRVEALLGERISAPRTQRLSGSWFARIRQLLGSGARWKEIAYFLTFPFLGTVLMVATFGLWAAGLSLLSLPLYVSELPGESAELWLFDASLNTSWLMSLVGAAVLAVVAPWATLACGWLSAKNAIYFLGEPRDAELREEVESLKVSRSVAATTAEAERQRIERDLHDGAQQRLVALAMDLGRAEAKFDEDPEAARALLSSARQEAAAALTELRDLIRGVHPAILSDRGLDAALSAVVARSPIPVDLSVQIDTRPPAPVESAAYFIVAEALMNVIKHAEATRISVDIARNGDKLALSINDNGKGGADPSSGTGLNGLQDRVTALGGWMHLLSPDGGPTSVIVELPCA